MLISYHGYNFKVEAIVLLWYSVEILSNSSLYLVFSLYCSHIIFRIFLKFHKSRKCDSVCWIWSEKKVIRINFHSHWAILLWWLVNQGYKPSLWGWQFLHGKLLLWVTGDHSQFCKKLFTKILLHSSFNRGNDTTRPMDMKL